jgi:phage terminase large subunit-like protein
MPRKPPKPDLGTEAVEFIDCLTHTGDYNGVKFALRPWQESMVRNLFGTLRPDGSRRYTRAFWALPRKQGKTELAAAILLYLLLGTGRRGQQLYSASGDRDQAALIFRAAAEMIRNDPELESVCHVYDGYKRIVCEPLGSFYQALSSDAPRKHGLRPSAIIFDELHVLPNRDLFNALTTAFGATREPLTIMITTAGHDRTSLCYEQWKYAEGVRDGLIDDPTFYPVIYAADPEDDWTSEEVWHKAMPGLGDFCEIEFVRQECKRAQQLPAYENIFKQLLLNLWTEQALRWLSTEAWARCGGPKFVEADLYGESCYAGFDAGVVGDMSVYVMVFPIEGDERRYRVLAHGWVPERGRWRDEPRNRDRYEDWHRRGYLTYTKGTTTDHQAIEDWIADVHLGITRDPDTTFPLILLLADKAYCNQLVTNLYNRHKLPIEGLPQTPARLNEPMRLLEELVISGRIEHGDNPILSWNVANAVMHKNSAGLMELDKEQATERIDGLAALIDALKGVTSAPDSEQSVHAEEGVLLL